MNDHEAMEAIGAVLDRVYAGGLEHFEALMKIAEIRGANVTDHVRARGCAK